jgi:hypothetical protein
MATVRRHLILEASSGFRPRVLSVWKSLEEARAEIERLASAYEASDCGVEGDYDFNYIDRPDGSTVVHSIDCIVIE